MGKGKYSIYKLRVNNRMSRITNKALDIWKNDGQPDINYDEWLEIAELAKEYLTISEDMPDQLLICEAYDI